MNVFHYLNAHVPPAVEYLATSSNRITFNGGGCKGYVYLYIPTLYTLVLLPGPRRRLCDTCECKWKIKEHRF